jgi:LCP family protein required for cell wall assembly
MSDEDDYERFFRPRPGATGHDEAGDEQVDGVSIDDSEGAQRVAVESRPLGHGARRQRGLLFLSAFVSATVLLLSGGAWTFQNYVYASIKKIDVFSGLKHRPSPGPAGAMNILLAGVDRRQGMSDAEIQRLHLGQADGARSDTMMLIHLSEKHDKVTVVSLPRDSLVTIPAHTSDGTEARKGTDIPDRQGKLNWAYAYGGPSLTIQTVEHATGIRIDHYVEVNFLGFLRIVDALGGVTVCTPVPIHDSYSGLNMEPGTHHIDGPTALAFARVRHDVTGGSDLGRIDRQQLFMAAMMKQALSTSTLANPLKFTKFLSAVLAALRVDKGLSKGTITSLAEQLKGLSTNSVTFTTVPLSNPDFMTPINGSAPQSTVQWDADASSKLFSQIEGDDSIIPPSATPSATATKKNDLTVPPGHIEVRVINGVGTRGLAGRAAGDLRGAGFTADIVPGSRPGATQTVIQYSAGREDSARTLKAAIPGATLKEVPSLGGILQVIVGASWSGAKGVTVTPPQHLSNDSGSAQSSTVHAKTATENLCK